MASKAYSDTHDAAIYLASNGWLALTSSEFRATFLELVQWRRYAAGEAIIIAGDNSGDMIGIGMGTAALTSSLGAADAPVTHIVTMPHWVGYAPLITGKNRIFSCTARSPVLAAQVRQSAVRQLLAARPDYWQFMAMLAFDSAQIAINIATDLMIRSSRRRCAATLLRIACHRFEDGPGQAIAWTNQEELGGIANLARSTLNLILGDLESEGLISRGYNQIILHNPGALRAIADG